MSVAPVMASISWWRRLPGRALAMAVAGSAAALAQESAGSDEAAEAGTAAPAGRMVEVAPPTTTTTTSYAYGPNFVPPPGTDLEAHLPSSSKAKTSIDEPDGFDLRRSAGKASTLRGDADNLGLLDADTAAGSGEAGKAFHIVRKGDTLWGVCSEQLGDPRLWPRVWSFNPQLQNPHWIYPGDQLRLRSPAETGAGGGARVGAIRGGTLGTGTVGRSALVPPETVFLREVGYIDDPDQETWGQVVGAREQQQLLADGNHVYMILRPGAQVQIGQLMTIFEDVRDPPTPNGARRPPGKLVAFKGTVKIDSWDANRRMARGEVVESLDVIERGAKVGPVGRRYYVVPPAESQADVQARILTSLHPHVILGREQLVFLDRGANDGLKPGNRLFVVRRGDAWRNTLDTTSEMARTRILMDVPERVELRVTPLVGDDEDFPEEVVAELRVIRSHRFSSLALVTQSSQEIEPGDRAVTRKGF